MALTSQAGLKTESVWGTSVTVDKFLPMLSEGVKNDIERMKVQAALGGRLVQAKWQAGKQTIGGPLTMYLPNLTMATILRHMFGTIATTGAGPTYTHTASPGSLVDQSFTLQVGRTDDAGTVQPFTYAGGKMGGWELSCTAGELAQLRLDTTFKSETTGTGLATASYASGWQPFTFIQGSVTIAGTPSTKIRSLTLACAANQEGGFHIGSAQIAQQYQNGQRVFSGRLVADFSGLTEYNRYVNATEFALVLAFSNGTDSLTITMNVAYDGETPNVSGLELVPLNLPYTATSGTSDAAAIQAVLINGDASAA
jgi:hypothetical protein